jgi:hypothetical protein
MTISVAFTAVAVLIVVRLFWVRDIESALVGSVAVVLIGTMVWFSDFWTTYILPFGFWQTMATDYNSPERSGGAIAMIGWVLLLLIGYAVFFA